MPRVLCIICGKEFYSKPSWIKRGWGKYCSKKCQSRSQVKGRTVYCSECGKEIWRTPRDFRNSKSRKFFCSKSCQTAWRNKFYSGPRHPLWAGGIERYRETLAETDIPVVCVRCGYHNEEVLIAHHKDGNRKNNKVENLQWLCRNCHYLIHKGRTI